MKSTSKERISGSWVDTCSRTSWYRVQRKGWLMCSKCAVDEIMSCIDVLIPLGVVANKIDDCLLGKLQSDGLKSTPVEY